jgi:YHS domain-containing protein
MFKKYSQIILAITMLAFLFSAQLLAQGKKKSNATKKSDCKQTECASTCADKSEMKDTSVCKGKSNTKDATACTDKSKMKAGSACADKSEMKEATSSKISNKLCPVMGEDVDATVETVNYKDKEIGFCCKKCVAKFKKDPEKYMKKLKEENSQSNKS